MAQILTRPFLSHPEYPTFGIYINWDALTSALLVGSGDCPLLSSARPQSAVNAIESIKSGGDIPTVDWNSYNLIGRFSPGATARRRAQTVYHESLR